jgi:hypothetical protein
MPPPNGAFGFATGSIDGREQCEGSYSDFGSAVGRHLEILQRRLVIEHERALLSQGDVMLRERISEVERENLELRRDLQLRQDDARQIGSVSSKWAEGEKKTVDVVSGNGVDGDRIGPDFVATGAAKQIEDAKYLTAHSVQVTLGGGARTDKPGPASVKVHGGHHDEEMVYELWPNWTTTCAFRGRKTAMTEVAPLIKSASNPLAASQENSATHARREWAISPTWNSFLFWQLLFSIVLCFELIVLPMGVFELPPNPTMVGLAWFCVCFWTCDLMLGFSTGFYDKEGRLVMSFLPIAKHYLRTWFVPDVVVVLIDWLVLGAGDNTGSTLRAGKALRYLRMARVLRMFRLHKLNDFMRNIEDYVNSVYFSACKSLLVNILRVLVISHFIGCAWYFVGVSSGQAAGVSGWLEAYGFDETDDWTWSYLTSLHWAMCQFTPGSMEIVPQNHYERAFGVLILVLGMMIFSSIVSSITVATNSLKLITARYDSMLSSMRRLLRQESISKDLICRVTGYADSVLKSKMGGLLLSEVEMLKMLPKPLYMEVIGEVYDQYLTVHPIFDAVNMIRPLMMHKFCCVIKEIVMSKNALLFSPGETAQSMFFNDRGQLFYTMAQHTDIVGRKSHFCEVVLWTPWVYQGKMESVLECELLALATQDFQRVANDHPNMKMQIMVAYGMEFVKGLNRMHHEGVHVSDLVSVDAALQVLPRDGSFHDSNTSAVFPFVPHNSERDSRPVQF